MTETIYQRWATASAWEDRLSADLKSYRESMRLLEAYWDALAVLLGQWDVSLYTLRSIQKERKASEAAPLAEVPAEEKVGELGVLAAVHLGTVATTPRKPKDPDDELPF